MKSIAQSARVSPLADLEDSTRGSLLEIGEGAVIDAFVKIKFAGGTGNVTIGARSYLNSGCVIYSGHGVHIGSNVLIAANCTLAATNHEFRDPNRLIVDQRFMPSRGGIIVEDDVWIGAGAVLLDGTVIRRGCVVGALSLVRGELQPYTIHGGNPLVELGKRA